MFNFIMEGVDAPSADAFRAFKRAMMLHRRLLMATFAGEEMHPAQAGCLQALAHRDGMSQSDLAEMLHVSRPTVTTMLQRMESGGTIERRPDEADSRVTRVYLTEAGRGLAERMHAGFAEMLNVSVGSIPDADKRELTRILGTLNEHVEAVLRERGVGAWTHPEHDEGAAR
jgi:DNA-binding MarR family transcriptional regulator